MGMQVSVLVDSSSTSTPREYGAEHENVLRFRSKALVDDARSMLLFCSCHPPLSPKPATPQWFSRINPPLRATECVHTSCGHQKQARQPAHLQFAPTTAVVQHFFNTSTLLLPNALPSAASHPSSSIQPIYLTCRLRSRRCSLTACSAYSCCDFAMIFDGSALFGFAIAAAVLSRCLTLPLLPPSLLSTLL